MAIADYFTWLFILYPAVYFWCYDTPTFSRTKPYTGRWLYKLEKLITTINSLDVSYEISRRNMQKLIFDLQSSFPSLVSLTKIVTTWFLGKPDLDGTADYDMGNIHFVLSWLNFYTIYHLGKWTLFQLLPLIWNEKWYSNCVLINDSNSIQAETKFFNDTNTNGRALNCLLRAYNLLYSGQIDDFSIVPIHKSRGHSQWPRSVIGQRLSTMPMCRLKSASWLVDHNRGHAPSQLPVIMNGWLWCREIFVMLCEIVFIELCTRPASYTIG